MIEPLDESEIQREKLVDLIDLIKLKTSKTQSQIALEAGYSDSNSLAQILSRKTGHRAATKKLQIAFRDILQSATHDEIEKIKQRRTTHNRIKEFIEEPSPTYLEKRRNIKSAHVLATAPLIPAKAQAGYVRAVDQERYMDSLEQFALPPNVDPRGAHWAYWEIEGDSMEPAFHSGDLILTSQVHPFDWENLRNFYVYVIVTDERILIKRVVAKNALEWVLISENEDHYPQQLLPVEYVKQLWVFRRRIESSAPPTKTFEIKV